MFLVLLNGQSIADEALAVTTIASFPEPGSDPVSDSTQLAGARRLQETHTRIFCTKGRTQTLKSRPALTIILAEVDSWEIGGP